MNQTHRSLSQSFQEWQRNELFVNAQNISIPPHYIPYDEPFMKREENTQVTRQLLANHLAFLVLLLLTITDLLRVVRCLPKRFSTYNILQWGRIIGADNKMLTTLQTFYQFQPNLLLWSTNNLGVNTNSLVDLNQCIRLIPGVGKCWKWLWTQLFPPLHVLWITPYLLTHRVENFCTQLAPKTVQYNDEWCYNGVLTSRHYRGV